MSTTLKNYTRSNVGTSNVSVYNPTTSNIKSTLIGCFLCNTSTYAITVNVMLNSTYIVKNLTIPVGNSLDIISGGKLIMQQNDNLYVSSSVSSSLDATVSVVEVV